MAFTTESTEKIDALMDLLMALRDTQEPLPKSELNEIGEGLGLGIGPVSSILNILNNQGIIKRIKVDNRTFYLPR